MRSLIHKFLSALLSKLLPDRTKRLVMLSSLYALVYGVTSFDSKMINKLNQIMNLSSADKALEFPMQLSSVIWRGVDGQTVTYSSLNAYGIDEIILKIMDKIPQCLVYSDRQSILTDISRLFTEGNNLIPN
jgi:hypothetical protein